MTQVSITVNGKVRKGARRAAHCSSCISCANTSISPAPTSAATPASAAPARCSSMAAAPSRARSSRSRPMAPRSSPSRASPTDDQLHPLQEGFWEEHGLQCGYCTPGMIMSAVNLLNDNPKPSEAQIREGISGNFCRCTGYQHIVNAIQYAANKGGKPLMASHGSCRLPKLVGSRVKRREDPRLIQGHGTYVDDVKIAGLQHLAFKRSDIAHGRITVDRHQRRGGDGRRRSRVHRQADRRVPQADADRHAIPVARPSRGRHRRRPLRRRGGCRRRGRRPLHRARCRRRHRRQLRPAAGGRRPRAGDDRASRRSFTSSFANNIAVGPMPSGTGVAPDGKAVDDSAVEKAFKDAEVVISQRMHEPPPRAERDGAARRRRALRAGHAAR